MPPTAAHIRARYDEARGEIVDPGYREEIAMLEASLRNPDGLSQEGLTNTIERIAYLKSLPELDKRGQYF